MLLPKCCHQKHYSISGIYFHDDYCDYSKSREKEKSTKSYFLSIWVSLLELGLGLGLGLRLPGFQRARTEQ